MTDTSTSQATENEPAPHDAMARAKDALREEADRLEQAKTALVHGVESVVHKFNEAVGSIGGHK